MMSDEGIQESDIPSHPGPVASEDRTSPNLNFRSWPRRATSRIPIIGRLWDCRWVHLRDAFYEVGCVILFSTLPLWFFPLISWAILRIGFTSEEVVANGELLIYAASFSGTMVYFISKRYGSFQRHADIGEGPPLAISISFPYGGLFVIASAFICMFSAASFFVLKTFDKLPPQTVEVIDLEGAARMSWLLFGVSSLLFYCAVAYRNLLDDSNSFKGPREKDVLDAWREAK